MEEINRKQEILEALKRREHERELQLAKLGVNADPIIPIELDDIRLQISTIEKEISEARITQVKKLTNQPPLSVEPPAHSDAIDVHIMKNVPIDGISTKWVWSLPLSYDSRVYNLILLHPSVLEELKQKRQITKLEQITILYRRGINPGNSLVKELIGPFSLYNRKTGNSVSPVYATTTTPEYAPDMRRSGVSMSDRLREQLVVGLGAAEIDIAPLDSVLYATQLEMQYGYPIDVATEDDGPWAEEEE